MSYPYPLKSQPIRSTKTSFWVNASISSIHPEFDLCALNANNSNGNCLTLKSGIFEDLHAATTVAPAPVWNPVALTESFAEAAWNPLSTIQGANGAIESIAKFTLFDKGSFFGIADQDCFSVCRKPSYQHADLDFRNQVHQKT